MSECQTMVLVPTTTQPQVNVNLTCDRVALVQTSLIVSVTHHCHSVTLALHCEFVLDLFLMRFSHNHS